KTVVPALSRMCTDSPSPLARLHALWTLEGMNELKPEQILEALKDGVAGVRENAVRLTELHMEEHPALITGLLALEQDEDARVRYQLLCTLGFVDTPAAAQARRNLLFRDIEDQWVHIAALSARSADVAGLLHEALAAGKADDPAYR